MSASDCQMKIRISLQALALGRAHGPPLLEALAAEHRTSLRWPKGNRGFLSALRAAQNLVMVFHGSVPPPETPIGKGTRRTLHEGLGAQRILWTGEPSWG